MNGRFKELFGIEPGEATPNDEVRGMIIKQENYLTGSKEYFDLFGKQPLEGMTNEQIFSAIANEKARISEANTKNRKQMSKKSNSIQPPKCLFKEKAKSV